MPSRPEDDCQSVAGRLYDEHGAGLYLAAAALAAELTSTVQYKSLPPWHEWLAGATRSAPDLNAMSHDLATVAESGAESLRLADIANALPFNGFTPGTEYNYRASQLADVSRLISARTLHFTLSKRGDEATASALSALKYRRALNDLPWYWRGRHEIPSVLSLSSPSSDSLERLQAALEAEESAFNVEEGGHGQRREDQELSVLRAVSRTFISGSSCICPAPAARQVAARKWSDMSFG